MKFYLKFLIWVIVPITKLVSKIRFPWSIKIATQKDVEAVSQSIIHGDVILTIDLKYFISNFFQVFFSKGKWFHAGLLTGDQTVIEATSKGVLETGLYDFLMNKDYYLVLRPIFCDSSEKARAVFWAKGQVGKDYDWALNMSNSDQFYCSELIYKAYSLATMGKSAFTLRKRFGVYTATPTDISNAKSKFSLILTNKQD
jgi:uncharacterized protein YycO